MEKETFKIKQTKNKITINFNDQLNVQYIDDIYNELKTIDFNKREIEFVFSDDASFDLAFIQVLVSLKKSLLINKQKLTIKGALTSMQKNVLLTSVEEINIAT